MPELFTPLTLGLTLFGLLIGWLIVENYRSRIAIKKLEQRLFVVETVYRMIVNDESHELLDRLEDFQEKRKNDDPRYIQTQINSQNSSQIIR